MHISVFYFYLFPVSAASLCIPKWVLSPDWLGLIPEVCDFCHALRWSMPQAWAWGREVRAVPRLCIVYTGICRTTEENYLKNLSQGIRKVFGWSAPNAILLVDLSFV